ncbi:MAG: hypothetical protein P8Z79_23630 [Sedimentisphaerales bacterium]
MMKRYRKSIRRWFFTLVTTALAVVTVLGCNDPMISEMETRHQEFNFTIEQELQRSRNASALRPASLPPAQAADMEAERRELDRMIERGEWQGLFN